MEDKVFPDDLLNVILDTTFQRHGVQVNKFKMNSDNMEKLRSTSMELLERVDEFLKRSKVEELTAKADESVQADEAKKTEEVKKMEEAPPRPIRRSFWGQL